MVLKGRLVQSAERYVSALMLSEIKGLVGNKSGEDHLMTDRIGTQVDGLTCKMKDADYSQTLLVNGLRYIFFSWLLKIEISVQK